MNKSGESKAYVFFDANIFLHCLPVQQMDIPKLLGVGSVTLLVAGITIQELDKHKSTHKVRKIQDRARSSLKMINDCMSSSERELCPGVRLELVGRPPSDFKQQGLDINWPDHQLVANVLIYKTEHPLERVVLIAHDTGPQLTARPLGIELAEIPEKWRIPPEEDPLVKENQRLKDELFKIKNAQPKLVLRLSEMKDEDEHHDFEIEKPPEIQVPDKNKIIAELRESYPMKDVPDQEGIKKARIAELTAPFAKALSGDIPIEEYLRYNKELEKYFTNYERYLDRKANYASQPARTLEINLQVRNIGRAPATDVDVYVHFPDGFSIYTEKEIPREPVEPKPPRQPQTATQKLLSNSLMSQNRFLSVPSYQNSFSPKKIFSLKRTNSYELREHCDDIKHGYLMNIRPIYLIFASFEEMVSFNFDYEISVRELPESVTGQLNIVIKKK